MVDYVANDFQSIRRALDELKGIKPIVKPIEAPKPVSVPSGRVGPNYMHGILDDDDDDEDYAWGGGI